MAASLNGFGTSYYGECDFQPDSSYVTTEWLIMAYLPVFPLRSHRLIHNVGKDKNWGVYNSTSYILVKTLPVRWAQALRIWIFTFLYISLLFTAIIQLETLNRSWPGHSGWLIAAGVVGAILPWMMVYSLRNRAKESAGLSEAALMATLEGISGMRLAPPPIPVPVPVPVQTYAPQIMPVSVQPQAKPPPLPQRSDPDDHERFKPRF